MSLLLWLFFRIICHDDGATVFVLELEGSFFSMLLFCACEARMKSSVRILVSNLRRFSSAAQPAVCDARALRRWNGLLAIQVGSVADKIQQQKMNRNRNTKPRRWRLKMMEEMPEEKNATSSHPTPEPLSDHGCQCWLQDQGAGFGLSPAPSHTIEGPQREKRRLSQSGRANENGREGSCLSAGRSVKRFIGGMISSEEGPSQ